jgi:hypothetical protein
VVFTLVGAIHELPLPESLAIVFLRHTPALMTLDKHQIDSIGGFNQKVLPAGEFEELMTSAGYSISGTAAAQGGWFEVW